jgi:hypothetical protein
VAEWWASDPKYVGSRPGCVLWFSPAMVHERKFTQVRMLYVISA